MKQEKLSLEVDQLLESVAVCEEGIANLPNESLESMLQSLQVNSKPHTIQK